MKRYRGVLISGFWLLATLAVGMLDHGSLLRALWPALVAVGVIVWLKHAAAGLACGVAAAAPLLAHGSPLGALRLALADYLFPAVQGPWRVGAIGFTLVLGSFAGMVAGTAAAAYALMAVGWPPVMATGAAAALLTLWTRSLALRQMGT